MAIQLRRGAYNELNINALLPGEVAVVLRNDPNTDSGKAVYICFGTGEVQRIGTSEDIDSLIQKLSEMTVVWTGSGTGNYWHFSVGETYQGIKDNDLYIDTTDNSVYLVMSASSSGFTIKPLDGVYKATVAPPANFMTYTPPNSFMVGNKWFNKTNGKYYILTATSGSAPSTIYTWTELTDSSWEQLATVDVEDLSDTPDGFIWDVSNYDDLKIIANGMTSVTGNRNFVLRITTSGGTSSEIGMFANLINQTSKDIKAKLTRNTGTATMEVTGSIMRTAYPYVDDASFNRDVSVPAGKITKVELFISGGGGLATGDITLLGRKRG